MKYLTILTSIILFTSCSSSDTGPISGTGTVDTSEWGIPANEVFDGGPGKDGIPSVDKPEFEDVGETTYLNSNDLVIGMVVNGEAKAYPHRILDWHEIVNDNIGADHYALTYCPLTGTGIAWDRQFNGVTTTFGVSGKLYNSNLIPYDRETDSYWSQLGLDCINGELLGSSISTFPVIETTWNTWKKAYPNSKIMTTETGFSRNYNNYPYTDYRTNHDNLIFPVNPMDDRLPSKERVLGIRNGDKIKAYSIERFGAGKLVEDNIDGNDIIVVGSKADNYLVAYNKHDLTGFQFVNGQLPIIAEDDEGNKISMDGTIVQGPRKGDQLNVLDSWMGYFFSFGAFYDVDIYEE